MASAFLQCLNVRANDGGPLAHKMAPQLQISVLKAGRKKNGEESALFFLFLGKQKFFFRNVFQISAYLNCPEWCHWPPCAERENWKVLNSSML